MASKKVFFLDSGPLVVRCSWLQISFSTAILSESSFLLFARSQILLTPTMIGWLGLPISSITKLLRVSKVISDSVASMSSSGISSASISLWCSAAAVWREIRLLMCCVVLHSLGLNVGSPFSFLRAFISLATRTGSALFPVLAPSSNFFIKKVLTLSVILAGRFGFLRAHPNGLGSFPLIALPLSSPGDEVDGTSGANVTPVTIPAHFLQTRSYMDSRSTSRRCLPVSIWL